MSDFERPTEGEVLWSRINLEIARENSERIRRGMNSLEPAERDTLRACVLNGRPFQSVASLPVPGPSPVPEVPAVVTESLKRKPVSSPGLVVRIPGRMFR